MASFTVSGSMNDVEFGPADLQINDELWVSGETDQEAQAVLDAILQAESEEQLESTLPRVSQTAERASGESAQVRAIHHGFTALQYRRSDGKVVRIV